MLRVREHGSDIGWCWRQVGRLSVNKGVGREPEWYRR